MELDARVGEPLVVGAAVVAPQDEEDVVGGPRPDPARVSPRSRPPRARVASSLGGSDGHPPSTLFHLLVVRHREPEGVGVERERRVLVVHEHRHVVHVGYRTFDACENGDR